MSTTNTAWPRWLPEQNAHRAARHDPLPLCRPSFFLVAAPKTGTTAMNNYLARHPDIFMAQKELHYFSHDAFFDPPLEEPDLAWHLGQFTKAGGKKLVGEASVFYLSSDRAAQRIKERPRTLKLFPDCAQCRVQNFLAQHLVTAHVIEARSTRHTAKCGRAVGLNVPKTHPLKPYPITIYIASVGVECGCD